jgi:hypothetical protein
VNLSSHDGLLPPTRLSEAADATRPAGLNAPRLTSTALGHPTAVAESVGQPSYAGRGGGILVTGSHRSGTTWAGKMLANAPGTCYLHEPFKPGWSPPYVWTRFEPYFFYISDHNARLHERDVRRTLRFTFSWRRYFAEAPSCAQAGRATSHWIRWTSRRLRGYRPIMKDPIALFSSLWLSERFGMDVVVMIRHPAAFVSSIKLRKWHFDFNDLLCQRELVRDLLAPFEGEIRALAARNDDLVEQAILQWRLFHHVIRGYQGRRPDWQFVRHEDLSRDPVNRFRSMFHRLGLEFTPECERRVRESSDSANPTDATAEGRSTQWVKLNSAENVGNWRRRLSRDEIRRTREGTEDVSRHFYGDADWE